MKAGSGKGTCAVHDLLIAVRHRAGYAVLTRICALRRGSRRGPQAIALFYPASEPGVRRGKRAKIGLREERNPLSIQLWAISAREACLAALGQHLRAKSPGPLPKRTYLDERQLREVREPPAEARSLKTRASTTGMSTCGPRAPYRAARSSPPSPCRKAIQVWCQPRHRSASDRKVRAKRTLPRSPAARVGWTQQPLQAVRTVCVMPCRGPLRPFEKLRRHLDGDLAACFHDASCTISDTTLIWA